jgi:hypothetical protein
MSTGGVANWAVRFGEVGESVGHGIGYLTRSFDDDDAGLLEGRSF